MSVHRITKVGRSSRWPTYLTYSPTTYLFYSPTNPTIMLDLPNLPDLSILLTYQTSPTTYLFYSPTKPTIMLDLSTHLPDLPAY